MTLVDLTVRPAAPAGLLDALPRRVTLTLPELRVVAELAGGAPLPFEPVAARPGTDLERRLGEGLDGAEVAAYDAALASLRDPAATLTRRGLLGPGGVEAELRGAVGLLATPETALELDVTALDVRARSWHRRAGDAVATLSTVDGIVFELTWCPTAQWPNELGRAPVLPEDLPLRASAVPHRVELPYDLADAAAEAVRTGRHDLVRLLVDRSPDRVLGPDGALAAPDATGVLLALSGECRGRLRALVADVRADPTAVGVVSWLLLADGWHALRPRAHGHDGAATVVVSAVEPSDLGAELAPVLAEVGR